MRNESVPVVGAALAAAAAFGAIAWLGPEPVAPHSGGILEPVPVHGPFDPVFRISARTERFTPPTNVPVSDPTGDDVGSVQAEVGMFVAGDKIVVGWNDAVGFGSPSSLTGYGYSIDRGLTWTDAGELPNDTDIESFGDPSMVRTNSGVWVFASLDQGNPLGLCIHRSSFFGPTLAFPAPSKFTDGIAFLDKEFLAYDPISDTVFMSYVNFGIGEFRLSRSTDNGATWSIPITIAPNESGNGAYPIVGIGGELYVSWVAPLYQPNGVIRVRYSADGGLSFPDPVRDVTSLGPFSDDGPLCFNRNRNITWPSSDVDRSDGPFRGRFYIAWCDGMPGDFNIYTAYSDDKGVTFSEPDQVNDNDNFDVTEQIFPQLRVSDTDGRVTVAWYDRRNDAGFGAGLCDYYVSQSVDGGDYWGPNRRMSDVSVAWCGVPVDLSPNFGDYVALAVDDRSVFAAWGDARNGDPDVHFTRKDDRHDLVVTADVDTLDLYGGDGTVYLVPNVVTWSTADTVGLQMDTPLNLLVASLGMSLAASPKEDDGVFDVSGESLTGTVTLTAADGVITGGLTLERTAANSIAFSFNADSDTAFNALVFDSTWTTDVILQDGDGALEVDMDGFISFETDTLSYLFAVDGTFTLTGGTLSFLRSHRVTQTATYAPTDTTFALTTQTLVDVLDVVPVPDFADPGTNPFPPISVGAKPNPWQPSTRVTYDIDRPLTGSIRVFNARGQLVRTLATGRFEAGAHSIPFDGRDEKGRNLGTGGYFVRFDNDLLPVAKKLFVLR